MRVLLDTQVFPGWVEGDRALPTRARKKLTANAIEERLPIVSADPVFRKYGVKRIW